VAEDEAAADRVWATFGWGRNSRVVTLNTGAAYGPAKSWPNEHFAALGRRISEELDAHVLVICGPNERQAATEIARQAAHPRVRSLAQMPVSIGLSKACVRRSRLMVSTDSGPRHFAAAFEVPLITLFGPTDPRWSDNYHQASMDLQRDLSCRPCAKRTCPLGHHECMRELRPDEVFRAVSQQLQATVPPLRLHA
jgi:heptosyltransferase-2